MSGKDREFRDLWDRAHKAGLAAGNAMRPTPMVVGRHENVLDDNSPLVQAWVVEDGVCGFAWVRVRPGTSAFARWLRKARLGDSDDYAGGVVVWVHQYNQSMQRKEAYARAAADVLRAAGVNAYSESRMD